MTSIGRDGESSDLVTGTKKPGIYVHKGTLIATTAGLLKWCDITKEILATTNMSTPMGDVVVLRALSDGNIQLAGPSMNDQLIEISKIFNRFGAGRVLIDGAISPENAGIKGGHRGDCTLYRRFLSQRYSGDCSAYGLFLPAAFTSGDGK